MKVTVQIVNAFVDQNRGGNPAGVVLDADTLTNEQKLHIAQQVGLSETAFVSKSTAADFKLEFFTPTRQIAHCGHATIATFSYLEQLGKIRNTHTSKETIDGTRSIKLVDDLAFMEQLAPTYKDVTVVEKTVLDSLGLQRDDLIPNAPMQYVNTGNGFIIVPVRDAYTLANITPNYELIHQVSDVCDLIGYYLFTMGESMFDATTRMFAPRYGITEEAATGMAAGPLACYLFDKLSVVKDKFRIRQGQFMNPPSPSSLLVNLHIQEGKIQSLMAGGKGIVSRETEVELPEA